MPKPQIEELILKIDDFERDEFKLALLQAAKDRIVERYQSKGKPPPSPKCLERLAAFEAETEYNAYAEDDEIDQERRRRQNERDRRTDFKERLLNAKDHNQRRAIAAEQKPDLAVKEANIGRYAVDAAKAGALPAASQKNPKTKDPSHIDYRDPSHFDQTQLIKAAEAGDLQEVRRLYLEENADPRIKDRSGNSAFDLALTLGYDEIAAFLEDKIGPHRS